MEPELSAGSSILLAVAGIEVTGTHSRELTHEHLFLAMCKLCDMDEDELRKLASAAQLSATQIQEDLGAVATMLSQSHVDMVTTRRELRRLLSNDRQLEGPFSGHRSPACRHVCQVAAQRAAAMGESSIKPLYLLIAILEEDSRAIRDALVGSGGAWGELCRMNRVSEQPLPDAGPAGGQHSVDEPAMVGAGASGPQRVDVPSGVTNSNTPLLDKFGKDVTALAREGKLHPCIGRRKEMRLIAQILRRQFKNNPVLVGEPGVGKTCIVEGLAQRIIDKDAPDLIRSWRVIEISMAHMIAGCMYQGQFEERMRILVEEARTDTNIILFMDELHTMVGTGGGGDKGMDAGQILKPALSRGELRLIGATTIGEYRKFIESDAALERRFQMIWVEEPSKDDTIAILEGLRPRLERHHGVMFGPNVFPKAVEWSMRYLPDHRLPDKAIDLIDQAAAAKAIKTLSPAAVKSDGTVDVHEPARERLTELDIACVLSDRCRVPVGTIGADETERLNHLEDVLKHRVQGQSEAIGIVSDAIRMARTGIKKPNRPMGIFLFLGPTGTGKTELAKALAEELFGNESALIRIDMSEYGEKHTVARLVGAPPGYIGHDDEGQLTGKIRTRPYSVVLFDEVEKAHPDVFDIFLQILDDGRLTDSKGRSVSFTETIIILTSNLGANGLADKPKRRMGFAPADPGEATDGDIDKARAIEAARDAFRPELYNRIPHKIVFNQLTREVVGLIVNKLTDQLNAQLAERRITIELTPDAKQLVLSYGYDAAYGARELERAFDRLVGLEVSKRLLDGNIQDGDSVLVSVDGQSMAFNV